MTLIILIFVTTAVNSMIKYENIRISNFNFESYIYNFKRFLFVCQILFVRIPDANQTHLLSQYLSG